MYDHFLGFLGPFFKPDLYEELDFLAFTSADAVYSWFLRRFPTGPDS